VNLDGHSFCISNLKMMTNDVLIDVILHDKEIEERKHK
jgi:riboflavin synthase